MLEFNQNHKVADISSIRHKLVKTGGRVLFGGVLISSVLLLGGCGTKKQDDVPTATIIIITNDDALLMDLSWYDKSYDYGQSVAQVKDMDGNKLLISHDNAIIVNGDCSHEKAEQIAEKLVGEKGKVVCYDEIKTYSKRK